MSHAGELSQSLSQSLNQSFNGSRTVGYGRSRRALSARSRRARTELPATSARRHGDRAGRSRARLAHRRPLSAPISEIGRHRALKRDGHLATTTSLWVKKRRRPLAGPSLNDARRRIPASHANQVAGTWLVRSLYTLAKAPQPATQRGNTCPWRRGLLAHAGQN